ncbi:MAG: DNA mismatch repair protein msh6, partial [Paramarteilia canceri]
KCINRGVCQVSSQEMRTYNAVESADLASATKNSSNVSEQVISHIEKPLLMAISVINTEQSSLKQAQIGICLCDSTSSKIILGQFYDDSFFSRLRTLLSNYKIGKVLKLIMLLMTFQNIHEKRRLPTKIQKLFKAHECSIVPLNSPVEFPDDTGQPYANSLSELALKSLGAIQWYLSYCKIDHEIFSMQNFSEYVPYDIANRDSNPNIKNNNLSLILDSSALRNLEIFPRSDELAKNSLFYALDFCQTSFGRRKLKHWLNCPCSDNNEIISRQNIIKHILKYDYCNKFDLYNLPDFERLLSFIHQVAAKQPSHPDASAVLFNQGDINGRKTKCFINLISGFEHCNTIIENIKE